MHETFNNNGKAISGFDVIEVLPNGHEIKKASFSAFCETLAENMARQLEKDFGGNGTYYFVRVRRYA